MTAYPTRSWSLIPLGAAIFLGALPNPATVVVQSVARALVHDDYVSWQRGVETLREFALPALRCWLLGAAVVLVVVLNLAYYSHSTLALAGAVEAFWFILLWLWLSLHLYVFPLLLNQERRTVRAVYRNAAVMVLARPFFTALVVPVWLFVLILVSSTGLITLIGLALGAAIQQSAFSRLVPTFQPLPS